MTTRRPIAAANWKMNLLRADAKAFSARLREHLAAGDPGADVVLFPGFTLLPTVAEGLAGSTASWGGQDLHTAAKGAHTGDTSGPQLTDIGCSWVLCGHSERRADHGEDDAHVARKALAAREHGLRPMICVGETLEEREAERTFEVLERQLRAVLAASSSWDPRTFAIAYEPVWAIGTGKTATPQLAQEAHAFLRSQLVSQLGADTAAATRLLYGGSAKPANVDELIAESDVDGFLVGGASLDPDSFWAIITASGRSQA